MVTAPGTDNWNASYHPLRARASEEWGLWVKRGHD